MTATITATTATYMNREIDAHHDDNTITDEPNAKIEVTVSIGEFDGVVIGLNVPGHYECAELDFTEAHRMMLALQDALNMLAAQDD